MKCIIMQTLLAIFIQVVFCKVSPSAIVAQANSHIGQTKWSVASDYGTGKGTNKCNQFVYDVLKKVGAKPPKRRWLIYSPIGAGEWGNQRSTYLKGNECWENCSNGQWKLGDVISDKVHVAIITGPQLTTSARSDKIVQNKWGYRTSGSGAKSSVTACWRNKC